MNFLIALIFIIFVLVCGVFAYGWYRNYQTQKSPNQKVFLKGTIPRQLPNGFYKGNVTGLTTTWIGKEFNVVSKTGMNVFYENGENRKLYPFAFYTGEGLADKNVQVIRIDYNVAQNPVWLRFILDEIVEVDTDTYLGKLHVRFPGGSFALGYFNLKKSSL